MAKSFLDLMGTRGFRHYERTQIRDQLAPITLKVIKSIRKMHPGNYRYESGNIRSKPIDEKVKSQYPVNSRQIQMIGKEYTDREDAVKYAQQIIDKLLPINLGCTYTADYRRQTNWKYGVDNVAGYNSVIIVSVPD